MDQFVGREIKVESEGFIKKPVAFHLQGRAYRITEILEAWQDHGFGLAEPLRKKWRLRHHRNYYRVRTDSGELFEIYYDRAPGVRRWFAYKRL